MDAGQKLELGKLVDKALAMTLERLNATPPLPMYSSIKNQLEFMHKTLTSGQSASGTDKARLTLHVIAARELETSDPDYADVLFDATHLFKKF